MSTVSKEIADDIIAGKYPEDGWVKIVKYTNRWGGTGYGCLTARDDPDRYRETEWVINPQVYWEKPSE